MIERAEFRDGVLHGTTAVFAPSGLVIQEMGFAQGAPDGPMLVHDANGQLLARLTWLAGVLDGAATIFNDGRMLVEMGYRAGRLDGETRSYSEAGVLVSTATYRDDRPNGAMTICRPDGSVMRRMNYVEGLLDGEATDHDERGVVRTRTLFKAGRRDGPMTEYDGDGNPISRTMFSADRQVGEKQSLNGSVPVSVQPWYQRLKGGRR
jgi:antitoxin component YwqK of YwqJK toxin-antitoxin module